MTYDSAIHHRRSIRLKGYNYSLRGLYFITICCQDNVCCFGKIENDKMILNNTGKITNQCWLEIPRHFLNVELHEYVVMPNHIHGIIELVGTKNFSLKIISSELGVNNDNVGAKNFSPLRPHGTSRTIGSIIRGFKIGVTKQLGASIWQRNYYEHIIRNEQSYQNISQYITTNPVNWQNDKFYVE
ncbi:MAG: hypothetical protein LBU34_02605 [Planctomycetaceae bacterium]|jgi:REP element-mobilizing transposase RayT|nr:hypothetical protein [Planctomycetaceae bacterium]